VVQAIQRPLVNLFIAADVGIGKTIEAGIVAPDSSSGIGFARC
jgi:hypothetical protein